MNRTHWTTLALAAALTLAACGETDDSEPASLDACTLAKEWSACDECYSGDVTCEYGDTSVTEASCHDCQARGALYAALCAAEVTDSRADIEAGATCSDPG
jgi:hypothetical protein